MSIRDFTHDLKVGQSLSIDRGRIVIRLEQKSGQVARLRVIHEGTTPVDAVEKPKGSEQAQRGLTAV